MDDEWNKYNVIMQTFVKIKYTSRRTVGIICSSEVGKLSSMPGFPKVSAAKVTSLNLVVMVDWSRSIIDNNAYVCTQNVTTGERYLQQLVLSLPL